MSTVMLKLLCCAFFQSFALLTNFSTPQWCVNHPSPALTSSTSTRNGVGSVVEVGGLQSYVSGSPDSRRAIVLASDIYGFEVPNLRLIADEAAAAGFFVVVPDFFHGDPYDESSGVPVEEWLESHQPESELEDAQAVVAVLRSRGMSAIGFAGFCWGGKVAVELSKTDFIEAVVLLHPTFVTVDDIKEVNVPIEILLSEYDSITPEVTKIEAILSAKPEIDSYVKVFLGVLHGWTTRYDAGDEKAVKAANEACLDMINWFIKYLH